LSNALYVTISIRIKFQVEYVSRASIFPLLTCGNFDAKLEILYAKMAIESLHVLQPFLAFCIQFGVAMTHNMTTFMLDPKYKGLNCVVDVIGKDRAWVLMEKYSKKIWFHF
jgi:hypothetical protein